MANYRGKLDIIADILKAASKNSKKTQIMFKCNLSHKVLQKYLKAVTSASLLSFAIEDQSYVITAKGIEFLEAYKDYSITNKTMNLYLRKIASKKKMLVQLCSKE